MIIGNYKISQKNKPFIIAEMSGNHNQSLERALKIVEAAADSGVHMLKLQTYTADTITINSQNRDFFIDDKKSLWKGKNLYELYKQAYTPWDWQEKIIKRSNELGMLCFSTPFDETAVDFLEKVNVPAYKISSFENVHLPLIKKVAQTGKPVILSTGLATKEEIKEAVQTLKIGRCKQYALLKCTSAYPAPPLNSNILTIPDLRKNFNCEVGLSDHTIGIGASLAAISHGATIIEKHFTLDRNDGGVDSSLTLYCLCKSIMLYNLQEEITVYAFNANITDYEYLETRFDLKTRTLAALLFLVQRGLAAGITIYAPAIILSTLLKFHQLQPILFLSKKLLML